MSARRTRLADVRVPPFWPYAVLAGLSVSLRQRKRDETSGVRIGSDLGDAVVTRWKQGDESTAAMIALTRTLARLTWVLLFVAVATLAVAVITLATA